ncbi:hypothetical protein P3S68_008677 [Capsicum galapagoense]
MQGTFIVQGPRRSIITFPEEIWGLMQLRHLKLPEFYLPNSPSVSADKGSHMGFSNIQTISYLSPCCCTNEVIMGIQNVKELRIHGYGIYSNGHLNNLIHLQQLETLSLIYCFSGFFPTTLKKLKMERTLLSWSYLDIIAELPTLSPLKYWEATDDNFLVLERLVLNKCHDLKEIPIEFAEIPTLQLIELTRCLPKLGESAAQIQREQQDLRNNPVTHSFSFSRHIILCLMKEKKFIILMFQKMMMNVDVAEDDDNEDSDADSAKHYDNYYLNWLFDVQNNLTKLVASAGPIQEEQEYLGNKANFLL